MNGILIFLILAATAVLANLLAERLTMRTDPGITEAFGYGRAGFRNRRPALSGLRKKIISIPIITKFLASAREKALVRYAAAGYTRDKSPDGYLALKYAGSTASALIAAVMTGNPALAAVVWVWIFKAPDVWLASRARRNNLRLQKHIYKIYRFLSNQITSGVRVADAVKSVYSITDDPLIRTGLIEVSAKFQLTNDIERSMEEFKKRFHVREVDSLTVALKQGIDTGSNAGILERQEAYMFNKYFGYIQAETEKCKYRCFLAAMVFCLILCILFFIPIFIDLQASISNIIS